MPTNIYSIKDVLLTQEKGPAKDHVSARYKTPAMLQWAVTMRQYCGSQNYTGRSRICQKLFFPVGFKC